MKQYKKVEITYCFVPKFSVKIGAGYGRNGIVDNAVRTRHVLRNGITERIYYIPASTAKGRIRFTFGQTMSLLFSDGRDKEIEVNVFGRGGTEGWLRFSDLIVSKETEKLGVTLSYQASTSIDRYRKTARQTSLRIEEYLEFDKGAVTLTGSAEGYRDFSQTYIQEDREESFKLELASILLSILKTTELGGDKSSGFGNGTMEIQSVKIDGQEVVKAGLVHMKQFNISADPKKISIQEFIYEVLS